MKAHFENFIINIRLSWTDDWPVGTLATFRLVLDMLLERDYCSLGVGKLDPSLIRPCSSLSAAWVMVRGKELYSIMIR